MLRDPLNIFKHEDGLYSYVYLGIRLSNIEKQM